MLYLKAAILCAAFITQVSSMAPSSVKQAEPAVMQAGFHGNNADAIAYVATLFHVPMVAEVMLFSRHPVTIPKGRLTIEDALEQITKQTKEKWSSHGEAIYVYSPRIADSDQSILADRLEMFTVTSKPSTFKYNLMTRVSGDMYHAAHPGSPRAFLGNGIVSQELDSDGSLCIPETLTNITVRDLLLKEAVPAKLAVVVLYPSNPTKMSAPLVWSFALRNWFWLPLFTPVQSLAIHK